MTDKPDDPDELRQTIRGMFTRHKVQRWTVTDQGIAPVPNPTESASEETPAPEAPRTNVVPREGSTPDDPPNDTQDWARRLFGRDAFGRS